MEWGYTCCPESDALPVVGGEGGFDRGLNGLSLCPEGMRRW